MFDEPDNHLEVIRRTPSGSTQHKLMTSSKLVGSEDKIESPVEEGDVFTRHPSDPLLSPRVNINLLVEPISTIGTLLSNSVNLNMIHQT